MAPIRLTYSTSRDREAPEIIGKVPLELTTRVQNITVCKKKTHLSPNKKPTTDRAFGAFGVHPNPGGPYLRH